MGRASASLGGPGAGARTAGALLICLVLLALLGLVSLAVGSRGLTLGEAWSGLVGPGRGTVDSVIVWRLRMPRTVLAIAVGACLAVAGVVMQALTRNPLAEPGILGVNAGASLAVVLSITALGVADVRGHLWFAFAGAALAAILVHLMARRSADAGPSRLVMAWRLARVWPFLAVGLLLALVSGLTLNALALGEEQARALGVSPARARLLALVAITLLCGASTAAVGPISFVGLVVPQVLRLALGADQRRLLTASLVAGPVLLLAADITGRLLIRPDELEAGVVTAFIGGPVLLAMVIRRTGAGT